MILKILVLVLAILVRFSVASPSSLASTPEAKKGCYVDGPTGGSTSLPKHWKLVWNDEFGAFDQFEQAWTPEHENNGACHGNHIDQVNCNVGHNAYLHKGGYLILAAHHEKYQQANYTGASLTSKPWFSYGRLEVRATQPVGKQLRTSIFTVNPNDTYWPENGQIDLASKIEEAKIFRGVHYAQSQVGQGDKYEGDDQVYADQLAQTGSSPTAHLQVVVPKFHIYGIEWSSSELRFFYDATYSKSFKFNKSQEKTLSSAFQLRLQLGVGGRFFSPPFPPQDFDLLGWQCPAMIVDYVRLYEPVESTTDLGKCPVGPVSEVEELKQTEKICGRVLKGGAGGSVRASWNLNLFVVILVVVLFLHCANL